jgi:hypothetical protein
MTETKGRLGKAACLFSRFVSCSMASFHTERCVRTNPVARVLCYKVAIWGSAKLSRFWIEALSQGVWLDVFRTPLSKSLRQRQTLFVVKETPTPKLINTILTYQVPVLAQQELKQGSDETTRVVARVLTATCSHPWQLGSSNSGPRPALAARHGCGSLCTIVNS